jgi:pimeloyl-ACP methyl ester carboxylesterase
MVAARRPSNLKGIILCASFVQNPVLFRPGWLSHLARPLPFRFFPVLSRLKALLNGDLTNELRALSSEALSQVRPEVLAHRVKAVLQIDVLDQLPHCLYPILYLRGERDYVVPGHNVREIVAARPSVEVVHIQSSHWLLQTQPAAAGAAIMNFVKRVTRRSS